MADNTMATEFKKKLKTILLSNLEVKRKFERREANFLKSEETWGASNDSFPLCTFSSLRTLYNKNVDIQFTVHDAFLE